MSENPSTLKLSRQIAVPLENVRHAFTNASALQEWLADIVEADARIGGRLYLWWNSGHYASGLYKALEGDREIGFTWRGLGDPGETFVEITLEAKDGGTSLTLRHKGIGSGEAWETTAKEMQRGWQHSLENLQSVLETGLDLRIYRRPMLGVLLDQGLSADKALDLGVPVDEGVVVGDVVPGMGAEAAGLQKGDVLVGLGDKVVIDFQSLAESVSPYQAGDTVSIVFYRGAEKKSAPMKLSSRPAPDLPPNPSGMGKRLRKQHEKLTGELGELLAGVSESAANQAPASDSWNAKETVAHLIATERDNQAWAASLAEGQGGQYYSSHNTARVKAIVASFPTLGELLEAFERAGLETAALVELLPPELVARKGTYHRIGEWLLDGTKYHVHSHFDQIQKAIAPVGDN
jgi:uncharacterized protein YndB with AHSA1/START domain